MSKQQATASPVQQPARADHGFLLDAELAESIHDIFQWQQYECKQLSDEARTAISERLAQIVQSNDTVMADGGFDTPDGAQVIPAAKAAEPIRVGDIERPFAGQKVHTTRICTVNADTLTAALVAGDACALNFANAETPGGLYRIGAKAQEEDLCRQMPELYACLAASESQYPIDPGTALLSRGLHVLRCPGTYEFCLSRGQVDIITAAMPCRHPTPGTPDWNETVKLRIRSVLQAGIRSGKPNLVLGAFGCGMFGNPPDHVARIFQEQLSSAEFRGAFAMVMFAIIGSPSTRDPFSAMACDLVRDMPSTADVPEAPQPVAEPASASAAAADVPTPAPNRKALEKKLRQIRELEEKQARGEALNADQSAKLALGPSLEAELRLC